jgi:hypothetical protein
LRRIDPILPHQRSQHARLRERGFADPRIAQQDGELVRHRGERADHLGGLAAATEEKVRIGFHHGGKAAVGRGVRPQLARRRTTSGGRVQCAEASIAQAGGCRQYRSSRVRRALSAGSRGVGWVENPQARDRYPMASRWLPDMVALEITTARWPTKGS